MSDMDASGYHMRYIFVQVARHGEKKKVGNMNHDADVSNSTSSVSVRKVIAHSEFRLPHL